MLFIYIIHCIMEFSVSSKISSHDCNTSSIEQYRLASKYSLVSNNNNLEKPNVGCFFQRSFNWCKMFAFVLAGVAQWTECWPEN